MKKIVITGATGFIGRYVCKKLVENDWEVFAVVRPGSPNIKELPECDNIHIVSADMSNICDILKQVKSADAFFHLAWGGVNRDEIDSDAVHAKSKEYSLQCVKTAIQLGCRVFLDAGSRMEYGKDCEVMSETTECHPVTAYGQAKYDFYRQANELLKKANMSFYHLRIFSVYGYGDHPWSLISTLTRNLSAGNKVSLSACLHQWNFMYIEDAADAMYGLIERGLIKNEQLIVNIASDDNRPLYDFVHEIHRCTGGKSLLEFGSFKQGKEGAVSIIADNRRMKELLPDYHEKHTFKEGIEKIMYHSKDWSQQL